MMVPKWMIGACVAVAAMAGSAVATAQTADKVGHRTVYVKVENRSGRSVIGTAVVPEDEAAKTSGAGAGESAAKGAGGAEAAAEEVAVAPYSEAWLVHEAVEPTEKQGSRAHRLRIMDAKTKRVLYDEVISMSKLGKVPPTGKVTPPTRYAGAVPLSYYRAIIYPKSLRYKVKVNLEAYVPE
jgi:hypothetical protein